MRAIFGGGQILVPPSWRVDSSVRGLGGLGDQRPVQGRADDAPELSIEGFVFAGGFAVMSELDADSAEWLTEMETKGSDGSAITVESGPEPATEPEMMSAG